MQLPYLNTASPLQLYFFSLNLSANIFVCDIKSQLSKSLHWTPFYVMISSTLWKRACAVLASCPIIIINIVEFYQYATEVHVCNMDCYEKHFVNSCIIAVSNIMLNGNFCILILNYLDFFLSMDVNFMLNFVAAPKMPSYFCCFPICFSLPDNCDQFQVPLQGIFALKVLWRVISSSAVRMGRSILTAAWRVNSSWIFFIWIDKIECFLEKMTLHYLFFIKI